MIAFVEHLDKNIAEVITTLKAKKLYDRTIIVFTSDNGGALNYGADNGPFNGGKGDMLEGGIRIPCVLNWPGVIGSGVYSKPFLLMDFYDLLPELASSKKKEVKRNIDDLLNKYGREHMVWVRREGHRFGGQAYYAVSDGQHKLLQNSPYEPFQLFHVAVDSLETKPLMDKGIEKKLLKILTEHIQESGRIPWQ